eukprot:gnl/MRDRNA2_/MRDRNA2_97205_c0_seq1.p1 gnl/MRDRNA2_/MRDRNA2_97205_c0~~gnl/MRDRNA2_/MRDRNA2_97205_c0_seq1.p1  ORF type:complete len:426 (+),score=84.36 gnl/MRDRNA2_/MRDRNA2_97205_c0_seq1:99-1376(+)
MTASETASCVGDVNQLSQAVQNKMPTPQGQSALYSMPTPGPFGPVAMLPYAAIPVDFSGHPMLLPQPQGFSQMGCIGPWASECRGSSPARRRRPRRGKAGACFGAIAGNDCQELRKNRAKVGVGASISLPVAIAVSDILDTDPTSASEDADLSMKILNLLESKDKVKKSSILGWICPVAFELALSIHGCRIVQKAFDVACGDEKRELAIMLHGHVQELLESQHGNHVLQKCIEVLPPLTVQFIIDELGFWPMSWVGVAKHRFGCRVIERLLEHCPEDMTVPLTDAVVSDSSALARHPYGNYVVQHVLEYGTDAHRKLVASALVDTGIAFLAQHRIASNVIESALGRICSADQQMMGLALLAAPQTLLVVGCSRYGTHVVNRLLEVLAPGPLRVEVVRQLRGNLPQIMESKHSKHLVEKLKSMGFD